MSEGSPYLDIVHSCSRFHAIGAAPQIQGKIFGFMSDRDEMGNQPHPTKLQQEKAFGWFKPNCCFDRVQVATHYGNMDNLGKPWKSVEGGSINFTNDKWLPVVSMSSNRLD